MAEFLTNSHSTSKPRLHPYGDYAFSHGSPWQKMYDINAKVVFMGCGLKANTFHHFVEAVYAEEIYSFKEVKSLYLMSGGFDLAVFVEGKNLGDVAKFVSEKLSIIDGITSVQTHFILKKYKVEGQITSISEESQRQIIGA
jgi:DNA-binding Lrp family transcriptional regulator